VRLGVQNFQHSRSISTTPLIYLKRIDSQGPLLPSGGSVQQSLLSKLSLERGEVRPGLQFRPNRTPGPAGDLPRP
jgi:hypothetical protein